MSKVSVEKHDVSELWKKKDNLLRFTRVGADRQIENTKLNQGREEEV